jgi:hypothetical protein
MVGGVRSGYESCCFEDLDEPHALPGGFAPVSRGAQPVGKQHMGLFLFLVFFKIFFDQVFIRIDLEQIELCQVFGEG